ncbi:MAG: COX15/CtaA family protein [Planctomycetota bacterium]
MNGLRRLTLITTILTLGLIAVGASVRAAGAGLGCAHWPKCFETHWLPPSDASDLPPADAAKFNLAKAWIEYANRLVGVVIGFFILATGILAWKRARRRRDVFPLLAAAVLLTGFQGWQGGQVVFKELDPRWVTVHLVTALAILLLLARALLNLSEPRSLPIPEKLDPDRARLKLAARAALVLVVSQVVLGALVRGTVDLVANENPDLARGDRLAEVGFIDHFHRQIGALAFFGVAAAFWFARRTRHLEDGSDRTRTATAALLLAAVQIAFGLGLAYVGLPPVLQVLHIATACALVVSLDWLQALAGRRRASVDAD